MKTIEQMRALRTQVDLDTDNYLQDGFQLTEIAAVYANQAMFIYRQVFNDDDYNLMIETMYKHRDKVKKLSVEDILRGFGIDISK